MLNPNNTTIKFDPIYERYKQPVGAIALGEVISLSILVDRRNYTKRVFAVVKKDGEDLVPYEMDWRGITLGYDEYSITLRITSKGLYFYKFHVENDTASFMVGADTACRGIIGGDAFVQSVTEYRHPAPRGWSGGVMYQIFPDRFHIGGGGAIRSKEDCVYRSDWGGTPNFAPDDSGVVRNNDFFGGNLAGIREKLDYLADLGVTALYLNPIFEAASNHKYDTGDYEKIDELFGTEEDFSELCRAAGEKGIRIILDGVFNHTGSDSRYFNRYGRYREAGAYQSKDSPYYNWYSFSEWPDKYDCWWGFKTLPHTREEDAGYNEFITGENGVVAKWLRAGASGWRLDVADELPDGFLQNISDRVKAVNPDAILVGEVWEDAVTKSAYGRRRRYFTDGQLDSVMNYPLREGIISFVRDGDSFALVSAVNRLLNHYPKRAADNLMNSLSTHDTKRILTELCGPRAENLTKSEKKDLRIADVPAALQFLKMAVLLQYTLPGFPCVYYGDEAGMEGYEDPLCRGCYPWGRENKLIRNFYADMGRLRRNHIKVFDGGGAKLVFSDKGVLIFKRFNEGEEIIVGVNRGRTPLVLNLDEPMLSLKSGEVCKKEKLLKPDDYMVLKRIRGKG